MMVPAIKSFKATSKYCDGDYFCTPPKECCTLGCCYLYAPPSPNLFSLIFWNHWYLWCVVAVAVLFGCGCGLWKRKSRPLVRESSPGTEPPTPDSCCHPPHYSRCSSFHQPPPYSEVTSKPDLYPLVISYSENGKTGGSYLMVQYFRNYIMRPVGSLSATSTADSLSSSLFCTASNEANSLIPPPYMSAPSSVEQLNRSNSPTQETTPIEGGVNGSVGWSGRGRPSLCGLLSNVSSLSIGGGAAQSHQLLDSPPQATTPTFGKFFFPTQQQGGGSSGGSSLRDKYKNWLSRSAPTTPSSRLTVAPMVLSAAGSFSPSLSPGGEERRRMDGGEEEERSPLLSSAAPLPIMDSNGGSQHPSSLRHHDFLHDGDPYYEVDGDYDTTF